MHVRFFSFTTELARHLFIERLTRNETNIKNLYLRIATEVQGKGKKRKTKPCGQQDHC